MYLDLCWNQVQTFFIFFQHTYYIYIVLAWLGERVVAANVKGHNLCLLNQAAWERKRRIEASRETKIFCLILSCGFQLFVDESKQAFFKHLPCLARLGRIQMHRQARFS